MFCSRDDRLELRDCSKDLLAFRMETGDMVWEDEDEDDPSASLVSSMTAGDVVTSLTSPNSFTVFSNSSCDHRRHSSHRAGLLSPLVPPKAVAVVNTFRASSRFPSNHSR